MTPAPRSTPLHPNSPNEPEFGGTNGVRFSRFTYAAPVAMDTIRTIVLMATSSVLVSADSLMPITSSVVTRSTMTAAGMLSGGAVIAAGIAMPAPFIRLTKYPDQPTATVDVLSAYSRMRSHPMIHANSSPAVAYAYVYALPATGTIDANSA